MGALLTSAVALVWRVPFCLLRWQRNKRDRGGNGNMRDRGGNGNMRDRGVSRRDGRLAEHEAAVVLIAALFETSQSHAQGLFKLFLNE